ncbi:MAG: AsmA family protein [Terracidiphilus sp.]
MSEEDLKRDEDDLKRRRKRRRLWMVLGASAVLVAALIVPPMVSINRYKSQITELISSSLGRPVHLSGVRLRLLPWPGFILSNLVVEGDPAYGYEPALHAETVTAAFRLLPLWSGRLKIGRISVDEASLNLVRMPDGRWNLDSLFRTANAKAAGVPADRSSSVGWKAGAAAVEPARHAVRLPYLEATNSRIDFKEGVEKLPFSIVNADLSFWQEAPGDWHIRLRGQPARTDVSLDQEDTGVLRLEASLHSAPELREMPLHVDLEWSEAQLGQLSRLLIGSDPGWRGDLTAELHVNGTADAAHITTRLQAAGVHRAEFAPAEPLDFDANCGFVYHYSHRSVEGLVCNSPLGDGHVRLAGDMPGEGEGPHLTLALEQIPLDAGLDFLRTIRSGIDPSLSVAGTVSGKMTYTGDGGVRPAGSAATRLGRRAHGGRAQGGRELSKTPAAVRLPLTGSFTVSGFQLTGDGLSRPIQAARITLEPEATAGGQTDGRNGGVGPLALTATVNIPAGAAAPLTFVPQLNLRGYELSIRGEASLQWAREFAHAAGVQKVDALESLTGGPVAVALNAEGAWLPTQTAEESPAAGVGIGAVEADGENDPDAPLPARDRVSGTLTIHDANWRADYLAHRVLIAQATLHLADGQARWEPVEFSYGALKGTGSLTLPGDCQPHPGGGACPAHFEVQFGKLDAEALQSALLGAREPTSLFTALIDRLHLSSAPAWPELDGTVKADSLELGGVTLGEPAVTLRILPSGARIESLDAGVLGGRMHLTGKLTKPATDEGQPAYALEAKFEGLSAPKMGRLLGMRWSGGPVDAEGKIELSGLTAQNLVASAAGTLHFEWRQGAVEAMDFPLPRGGAVKGARVANAASRTRRDPGREPVPPALRRFWKFAGDAEIGHRTITLRDAEAQENGRRHAVKREVTGEVTLTEPPRAAFAEPRATMAAKRQISQPIQ